MAIRLDPAPQVWGITGNLGGGKTLTAVSLAVSAMCRGCFVVSNVTLKLDAICAEYGPHLRGLYQHFSFEDPAFDPFDLPVGSPRGSGGGKRVVVILDECAEWVDQYSTAKDPRIKRFWSWLRHSSKRSQDVVLIVQRLEYLNKVLRLLISKWVIVDDLRLWRIPVVKARLPFMGGWCMQRVFDRNRKLVQGPLIVKKTTWGAFYDTAECLNNDGATHLYEYAPPKVEPNLAGLLLFAVVSVLLPFIAIVLHGGGSKPERIPGRVDAPRAASPVPAAPGGAITLFSTSLMGQLSESPPKRTQPQGGAERVGAHRGEGL